MEPSIKMKSTKSVVEQEFADYDLFDDHTNRST